MRFGNRLSTRGGIGMKTGLFDKYGTEIKINDLVLFDHHDGCKWAGVITFEDGVVTICDYKLVIQVRNPDNWDHKHDWIKSRWWATKVGYGEYGSWNCSRRVITQIADNFKDANTYLNVKTSCSWLNYYDFEMPGVFMARAVNCHVVG